MAGLRHHTDGGGYSPSGRSGWPDRSAFSISGAVTVIWKLSAGACVWLLLWTVYASSAELLPVSVPVRFGIDKAVEFSATIDRNRNYYINLVLHFQSDEQRAFARALIGEQAPICKALNDCGEIASFKVTIETKGGVLLQQTRPTYGHFAYSSTAYYRNILITPLKPGRYNITIDIIEFGQAMLKADTSIELSTDSREADLER